MNKSADLSPVQHIAFAMLAGLISAGLTVFSSANFIFAILAYFATLPLFLTGFILGLRPLFIAASIATGFITVLSYPISGSLLTAITYAALNILPVCWIALYSKRFSNADGELLFQVSIYAIGMLILTKYLPGFGAENHMDVDTFIISLQTANFPSEQLEQMKALLTSISAYLPGIMTGSWLLMLCSNWFLAKKLNSKLCGIQGEICLPRYLVVIFAILGGTGYLFGQDSIGILASNAYLVLLVPCFVSGMSTINLIAKNKGISKLMVGLLWIFMLFFPILIKFVVLLGIFEPWLHLRSKFARD